jgi:hypothetical protein
MQPLETAFMNPFKTYNAQETEMWLKAHQGRVITHYQVAALFGKAYARSATIEVAVNGFRNTGIFPFQPNVFREQDFATKITYVDSSLGVPEQNSTSFAMPSDITPIPDFQRPSTSGNTTSRKGSACLVTGSPHKRQLLECTDKQSQTVARKTCRRQNAATRKSRKGIKKHESSSSSGNEEEEVLCISTCDEDSDDDAQCPYCNKNFSEDKKGEKWVRCTKCFYWCHESCAGDSSAHPKFICAVCLNG